MDNTQIHKVSDNVHWIGVLDPDLVTFDVVMETRYGTTYNSYLIIDEQVTIVETAKAKFWKEYEAKIRALVDPAQIKYIVLNHTEPDHTGSVSMLLEIAPEATVVASGVAIRNMHELLGHSFKHQVVKDGDTLRIGSRTLKFIGAPNLHWPDSIYTWLEPDKLLFTCDSFGAHYCDERIFDDEAGNWDDAFKYYFDVILKPFSRFMLKAIEKIRPLDIKMICPGHGPILRSHWKKYVDWSEQLSLEALATQKPYRVFVPYVSAYHNTGLIAEKIAEGLESTGRIEVALHDIETMPAGELDAQLASCSGIIIGTPTINQNILPQIYTLFAYMSPIRDRGKLAGAFGSYGWSGEAEKMVVTNLENLKLLYFGESLFVKFTPHHPELAQAFDYGKRFAEKLLTGCGK